MVFSSFTDTVYTSISDIMTTSVFPFTSSEGILINLISFTASFFIALTPSSLPGNVYYSLIIGCI